MTVDGGYSYLGFVADNLRGFYKGILFSSFFVLFLCFFQLLFFKVNCARTV